MDQIQTIIVAFVGVVSLAVLLKGYYESTHKNNPFGLTDHLFWLGMFVWGDAVILGLFWLVVSVLVLVLNDWLLFLLIIAVFWAIRSLGEIIYWLNQQFSTINRNPPENLKNYHFFKNDSIWFVYQVFWQCVLVFSIVATIYLSSEWLKGFSR